MSERSEHVAWLTQDAYDRLQGELEELSGNGRAELARKIEAAREEGDLKENGGYHAAKEEQGKQEARIRQLTQLLTHAQVGAPPTRDGVVSPGMVVIIAFSDGEQQRFLLGSREVSVGGLEVYSEQSPLGAAILGRRAGETVSYDLPNGNSVKVSVVSAEPFTG